MFRTSLISCFRRPTPFHPGIFTFRPLRPLQYFAYSSDLSILLILYIRSRVYVHWQCGCRIPPASPSSAISSSRVIRAIIHQVRSNRRNQTQTKSNFFLCILPRSIQESRSILNFSARPLLMPLSLTDRPLRSLYRVTIRLASLSKVRASAGMGVADRGKR